MSLDSQHPEDSFPTLSRTERDRRWQVARQLMDEQGVDGLIVFGLRSRENFDHYFTNESLGGIVVLPRHGQPMYVTTGHIRVLGRYDAVGSARERWVDDIRIGAVADNLRSFLHDHGLNTARWGVVGLGSDLVTEPLGIAPYSGWLEITNALPDVTFVDVSIAFALAIFPRSEEEITLIRKAAAIGEAACHAFVARATPGARESEAYGAAMQAIYTMGGNITFPNMIMRSGPESLGWYAPEWLSSGGEPRRLQKGDMIAAEIFALYGGLESQQQIAVSVGPAGSIERLLGNVARESYEIGVNALKPGAQFRDICDAMQQPLSAANCWNIGPLIQTLPVVFNGPQMVGAHAQPGLAGLPIPPAVPITGDFEIKAGMVFALEPNALRDKKRVCVGGTVLVTESGCEELNILPNNLVEV